MVLLSSFATAFPRQRAALFGTNPWTDSANLPASPVVRLCLNGDLGFIGGIDEQYGGAYGRPSIGQSHASGGIPYR